MSIIVNRAWELRYQADDGEIAGQFPGRCAERISDVGPVLVVIGSESPTPNVSDRRYRGSGRVDLFT